MDAPPKEDPFDLENVKKIKIKEYLVFKGTQDSNSNYVIKEVEDSKEFNLNILQSIQQLIKVSPDMTSEEVAHYLKQQRIFIKRYLKEVNRE